MATFWNDRSIKAKLLLGIGAILAIFAFSCALVLFFVNNLASSANRALDQITPARIVALDAQFRLVDADDTAGSYVMDRNPANWAAYLTTYTRDIAAVRAALPKLATIAQSEHERATIGAFSTWFDQYVASNERTFGLKRAGRYDLAVKDFTLDDTSKGTQLIADFAASMASRTSVATAEVEAGSRATVLSGVCGAIGAIAVGAIIAFALGGSIAKRLQFVTGAIAGVVRDDVPSLTRAMQRFAAGELGISVKSDRQPLAVIGKDETAMLAASYNDLIAGIATFGAEFSRTGEILGSVIGEVKTTVDAAADGDLATRVELAGKVGVFRELSENLNRLMDVFARAVVQIQEAASVVSTSAREIASGNSDLSQRTEEQAASLEETAASMEQLTATVHQNAENAKQANVLAIGASTIAVKGGDVVGEVVSTMAAINGSGRKIVDIISVIDGIAFQTNILALNAAVEAARAGEQGRGFAVVAGEVRTLAQRSAAAAKEIKQLIGDSVEKTDAGTRLVAHAGETMAEIVTAVKRVTEIMSAIAAASAEQGSGIGQVNEAVAQMDKVTQQNAALVEEIAASASVLEERASGLVDAVSTFTLTPGHARSPQPKRQVPVKLKAPVPALSPRQKTPASRIAAGPDAGSRTEAEADDWSSF